MDSTGSIPLRPNLLHDPVPGSALDIVAYASRENGVAILTEGQLVADATVAATRRPVLHGPTKVVPFQGSSPGTGSKAQKFMMGSVCSQRIHGVRLCGAPCGDVAGWYGDENDNETDGGECQWVGCADVVHKGPQHS